MFSSGFPRGKRPPHVHIVISDSVDTDPGHMKARSFYLHASTDAAQTSCWALQPALAQQAALGTADAVDGGTLDYWRLTL